MKPLIGITPSIDEKETNFYLHVAHCDAIIRTGGLPYVIPYNNDLRAIEQIASDIDALYLTGGYDIDPHYFNEEPNVRLGQVDPLRDQFELQLVKRIIALNKPVFGVCRGAQIINVALGGTMYQDLYLQKDGKLIQHVQKRPLHYPSHYVQIDEKSLLYEIVGETSMKVNSNHHQANDTIGKDLRISATSEDGVIEAIESNRHPFIIGVQWHPERLFQHGDPNAKKIYERFIQSINN